MSIKHAHRGALAKRLSRVAGHVVSIRTMVEEDRDCTAVLQQMTAVLKAMEGARQTLLLDHLESCIVSAVRQGRGAEAIEELERTLKLAFR